MMHRFIARIERRAFPYLLLVPSLLWLLAITVIPALYGFGISLYKTRLLRLVEFVGLHNYSSMFSDPRTWNAIKNSLVFTFGSLIISIPLGFGLALLLNRRVPLRTWHRAIILIPWILPQVVAALQWRWMLQYDIGLINHVLALLGIARVRFLGTATAAMMTLIATNVWRSTPFVAVLALAGLQGIPQNLYRASAVDGASRFYVFRRITLPLMWPTLVITIILLSIGNLNLIEMIMVLTGGGPLVSTETLSLYMYKTAFSDLLFSRGSALAVLVFLVNVILTLIYLRSLPQEQDR